MTNTTTTTTAPTTATAPTSTSRNRKGAVKGTFAAAAGIAVLLGGMGTFALWNVGLGVDAGSSATGSLAATFDGPVDWQDVTPGHENAIDDITAFRMVPGDEVAGEVGVTVTTVGENLVVDATLDTADAGLPDGVEAEVTLNGEAESLTLTAAGDGQNGERTHKVAAVVTLTFDSGATAAQTATIDLSKVKIDLTQSLNG